MVMQERTLSTWAQYPKYASLTSLLEEEMCLLRTKTKSKRTTLFFIGHRVSAVAILPSDLSEDSWKESGTRFAAQFPTKSILYPGSTIFLIMLPYGHL